MVYFLYSDISGYTVSASQGGNTGSLLDYNPNNKWVSGNTNSHQWIQFKVNENIDTIIIANHNLSGSLTMTGDDAVWLLRDNNVNFSSPEYVTPLVEPTRDIVIINIPATTDRYFRFYYSGSLTEAPYLGNVFFCKKVGFQRNYNIGYKINNHKFDTVVKTAINGRTQTYQKCDGKESIEATIAYLNDTKKAEWVTFANKIKGRLYPFYFLDDDNYIHYVSMAKDYTPVIAMKTNINDVQSIVMDSVVSIDRNTYTDGLVYIYNVYEEEHI